MRMPVVAEHLDHRPGPKGPVLSKVKVAPPSCSQLFGPDPPGRLRLITGRRSVSPPALNQLAFLGRLGRSEQFDGPVPFGLYEVDQGRQHREALSGALIHARLAP